MADIKYQIIKVPVIVSGESIRFSADTDKMFKKITGLFASVPDEKAIAGATLELKIADKEIFPEEWEMKMITCGQQVTPNDRFFNNVQEEAKGNRIDGRFTDGSVAGVVYPYIAKLYLRLEEKV
ncbi:MAG: hypothetical protein KKA07_07665 [Bacteroidetes bacterium]|nr:hypothetical protein [Bacteroidota bacterium]MBU1718939.1 hypothetical protein [Bacteroidota bacterium]